MRACHKGGVHACLTAEYIHSHASCNTLTVAVKWAPSLGEKCKQFLNGLCYQGM